MALYRRKPTTIEAWCWQGGTDVRGVCVGACGLNRVPHVHTARDNSDGSGQLVFLTLGDWITPEIGKENRYYPIKPHVFAMTYEYAPETVDIDPAKHEQTK